MAQAKIDTTEYLVLADLSRGWELFFPFYKTRSHKPATGFIWDGHSDRRTVYKATITALIKKGLLIQLNRGASPLLQYKITEEGKTRAETYKKNRPVLAALGEIGFAK